MPCEPVTMRLVAETLLQQRGIRLRWPKATPRQRQSHQPHSRRDPLCVYLPCHRPTSFTGPAARSYTYDGPRPRGARGRMTNITTGSVNQYGINALGQRLTKAGTGYTGTQRFAYGEDGKLIGEYDNTGALITETIYLNDTPIAAIKAAGAYLIRADHLNTPRAILGASNGARLPVSKRFVACADSKKKSRALLRFLKLLSCSRI